ncbi:uncharacterized protein LJ206_001234 isoform 1-T1 [Theristicus caerulescens]
MERSLCLAVSKTPAAEQGKEARVEAAVFLQDLPSVNVVLSANLSRLCLLEEPNKVLHRKGKGDLSERSLVGPSIPRGRVYLEAGGRKTVSCTREEHKSRKNHTWKR